MKNKHRGSILYTGEGKNSLFFHTKPQYSTKIIFVVKNYVRNLHFLMSKLPQKKTKPLEHKCFRYCDGPHILSQQKKPLSGYQKSAR